MSKQIRILGIAGSLRRESFNRAALRAATEIVPEGATIDIFELDGIPGFNQDEEQNPPAKVVELKKRIREADAVLIVTPEYNYSVPGVLKNAIDWASRPYGQNAFTRKPSAVIGTSPGKIGTAVGQQHLRSILGFCNSPQMNALEAYIQFTPGLISDDGEVTDQGTEKFLRTYMAEFYSFIGRVHVARTLADRLVTEIAKRFHAAPKR